ncbi:MAG: hypothetical protein IPI39_12890 [Candidatus Obscuribacter sp.]|nr:hypothetical protein [Candidatus Obscuribacter sp.]
MRRAKIALFAGILSLVMADLSQTMAYGQNVSTLDTLWSRLNLGNLQNLLDTNDASEAELMLKAAIASATASGGASNPDVLQLSLELSRLYRMQSRYGELKVQLANIAGIYGSLSGVKRAPYSYPMLEQARDLIQHDRVNEARMLVTPVVDGLSSDKTGPVDANVLTKLSEIAEGLKSHKASDAAEPIYRVLIAAYERLPESYLAVSDARTKLAEILRDGDRISAAIELASLAYDGQQKAGIVSGARGINTLVLLTSLQLTAGQADAAKQSAAKLDQAMSHALTQDLTNQLHPILSLCKQFAQVGDYQSVKVLFDRSLVLADKYSYSQYDTSLREIARALIATSSGDGKSRAASLYVALRKWAERPDSALGPDYVARVIVMTARFYAESAQYDKLATAMTELAALDNEHHSSNLGLIVSQVDDTQDSQSRIKYYELLTARPGSMVGDRRQYVHNKSHLADCYLKAGRTADAKRQWYQMVQILKDSLPADCKDLGDEVVLVLDVYAGTEQYDQAMQLTNNMAAYGFDRNILISAANGYLALSHCQQELSNLPRAELLAERALQVSGKYGGKMTNNYCYALSQSAAILRKSGKLSEAQAREKEAESLRKQMKDAGMSVGGCG